MIYERAMEWHVEKQKFAWCWNGRELLGCVFDVCTLKGTHVGRGAHQVIGNMVILGEWRKIEWDCGLHALLPLRHLLVLSICSGSRHFLNSS